MGFFVGDIAEADQADPIRLKAALPLIRSTIYSFQQDEDGFFQIWMDLVHGLEEVSNNIHFLGAGHISVFLHE